MDLSLQEQNVEGSSSGLIWGKDEYQLSIPYLRFSQKCLWGFTCPGLRHCAMSEGLLNVLKKSLEQLAL